MTESRTFRFFCILIILFLLSQLGNAQPAVGMIRPTPAGEERNIPSTAFELQSATLQATPLQPIPTQPVVARIFFTDQSELNRLAQSLDIWEVHHAQGFLIALVSPQEWNRLAGEGYRIEVNEERNRLLQAPESSPPGPASGIPNFPCYRTVEETYASMHTLETSYPNLAQVIDIGDSWDKVTQGEAPGYDLLALKITNRTRPGPKPVFFLMAEIHAREYTTAELAMRFAEKLVQDYNTDPDITWLLDYYEVDIVPMTNPDGRKFAETGSYWRKNTDSDDGCTSSSSWGVDLNRNSNFKWGAAGTWPCGETYQGPTPKSEPETQAIQDYVASLFPDQRGPNDNDPAPANALGLFITLHSYSQLVLYPWGWSPNPAPNLSGLRTLGRKFGFFNGYEVCQSGESGCLYATTGSTDDWAYGTLGVAAYTFEMGTSFFESCTYFENTLLPGNLPALSYAFKAARQPYLDPSGPETLSVTASPATIAAGEAITLTAVADDTRYNSHDQENEPAQPIAAARYSIDSPSWQPGTLLRPLSAADGGFTTPVESLVGTVQPGCLPPGKHTLFVESQDSAGNWGVPSAAFFQVSPPIGLDRLSGFGNAQAGETITYTLQITNLGSLPDTFTVVVASLWSTSAPTSIGPIGVNGTIKLSITVQIPPSATPGDSDVATVSLTSMNYPCYTASLKVTSFVPKAILYLPFTHR